MAHSFDTDTEAQGLIDYVDASPTPFHACEQAAARLAAEGFTEVDETEPWPTEPGRHYLVRGGSLIAWDTTGAHGAGAGPAAGFRVVGAHTDSPNLRIKPNPDHRGPAGSCSGSSRTAASSSAPGSTVTSASRAGSRCAAATASSRAPSTAATALLRVAQLAIHLDRTQNEALTLNKQAHMEPLWGVGDEPGDFVGYLAEQVGVDREDVLSWDVMTHDRPAVDAARARRRAHRGPAPRQPRHVVCRGAGAARRRGAPSPPTSPSSSLFDHEEIGSTSERGATSTLLPVASSSGSSPRAAASRDDYWRALAGTVIASGDMAHATHPNYADRHEPMHQIAVNGGPVLKVNTNLRYATDSVGAAAFRLACEQAGVPMQTFVTRSDLPCGSTVGPDDVVADRARPPSTSVRPPSRCTAPAS